jgi:hypothetical protein
MLQYLQTIEGEITTICIYMRTKLISNEYIYNLVNIYIFYKTGLR